MRKDPHIDTLPKGSKTPSYTLVIVSVGLIVLLLAAYRWSQQPPDFVHPDHEITAPAEKE